MVAEPDAGRNRPLAPPARQAERSTSGDHRRIARTRGRSGHWRRPRCGARRAPCTDGCGPGLLGARFVGPGVLFPQQTPLFVKHRLQVPIPAVAQHQAPANGLLLEAPVSVASWRMREITAGWLKRIRNAPAILVASIRRVSSPTPFDAFRQRSARIAGEPRATSVSRSVNPGSATVRPRLKSSAAQTPGDCK